jgi:hypothetical protein
MGADAAESQKLSRAWLQGRHALAPPGALSVLIVKQGAVTLQRVFCNHLLVINVIVTRAFDFQLTYMTLLCDLRSSRHSLSA